MNSRLKTDRRAKRSHDEVWADPIAVVAERYGMSDVGLAKVCQATLLYRIRAAAIGQGPARQSVRKVPLPELRPNARLRLGRRPHRARNSRYERRSRRLLPNQAHPRHDAPVVTDGMDPWSRQRA